MEVVADGRLAGGDAAEEASSPQQAPRIGRLGMCDSCGEAAAKYKCPACEVVTCSLACSREHKQDMNCSGKRDRTAYVNLSEFTERHLVSDYRFLEEALVTNESSKRIKPNEEVGSVAASKTNWEVMRKEARNRGVELLLQAKGMQRRRMNTSYFCKKRRKLIWRVTWKFVAVDAEFTDPRVEESTVLASCVERHLRPQGPDKAVLGHRLRKYQQLGAANLRYFLPAERCPANRKAYFEIDITQALGSQLTRKTLLEFPTIHVVLPGDAEKYPVLVPVEAADTAPGPADDAQIQAPVKAAEEETEVVAEDSAEDGDDDSAEDGAKDGAEDGAEDSEGATRVLAADV